MVSNNLISQTDILLSTVVYTMLETLIQFKTRLKLLLSFFLNPDSSAYLRGLAQEFDESTNALRVELNRFEEAGLIQSHKEGNRRMYQVNASFPVFSELQKIAFKHFGINQIIEQVIEKLGDVEAVYLTGDLARGLDTNVLDVTLIGTDIDNSYLSSLVQKSEELTGKKIRTLICESAEKAEVSHPRLLNYGE